MNKSLLFDSFTFLIFYLLVDLNLRVQAECVNGTADCAECERGFYKFPDEPMTCVKCSCDTNGATEQICDPNNGTCLCKEAYSSEYSCSLCAPFYFGYPNCSKCACSDEGALNNFCDPITGKCLCILGYQERDCGVCPYAFHRSNDTNQCELCQCNHEGSLTLTCGPNGKCACKTHYNGLKCENRIPQ